MKLLTLCVILSVISGGLAAEPSPSCRIDEGPNVIGQPPTNSPSPPSTPNTSLLATLDGMVYLVELNSGKILWSFKSGSKIYSLDKDINQFASQPLKSYIDYEEDGNLYYKHVTNNEKVKIPYTPVDFISNTPHFKDGGVIVGSKNTTVFLIDSKTGKVLYRLYVTDFLSENTVKEDEIPDSITYVARKDYRLKFFSEMSSEKSLWCLEFSDIEIILQCEEISPDKRSIEDRCTTRSTASHKIRHNNVLESLLMLNR